MTVRSLPPPCPNCSGTTTLKEMHKLARDDRFMCFFRCEPCELDYPLAVGAQEIQLAGWSTRKSPRNSV
jgi:hypothetical protein